MSGNDEGDGADGVNDSMGIQEDDVELSELIRWVVCTIARDTAMAAWCCSLSLALSYSTCLLSRKAMTGSCAVIALRAGVS